MRERAAGSLVLVLDENLSGKTILAGLLAAQVPARPQTDFIRRGSTDQEVLRALAPHRECFLLSKDSDFHRKTIQKKALTEHRIGAFVITSHKGKTGPELVELITRAWPRIQAFAARVDRPFAVKILANGHIDRVL